MHFISTVTYPIAIGFLSLPIVAAAAGTQRRT